MDFKLGHYLDLPLPGAGLAIGVRCWMGDFAQGP